MDLFLSGLRKQNGWKNLDRKEFTISGRDCIKTRYEVFSDTEGMSVTLEWNEGNHFVDVPERMAKGFAWCIDTSF